ncbi:hypothetical protein K0M31_010071, partial [Melipona bicolor]
RSVYAKVPVMPQFSFRGEVWEDTKSRRLCTDKAVKYTRNAGTCANFRESPRQTTLGSAGTQTNVAAGTWACRDIFVGSGSFSRTALTD